MLQRERGELGTAERELREYAVLVARQVALEPGKLEWRKESGYADSNVATLLLDQGRAREAVALFETSLRKSRQIMDSQPDVPNQIDFTQGLSWLSSARLAAGDVAAARRDRESEIARYRRMLRVDGNNHQVEERLLYALRFLAELHLAGGDVDAAGRDLDEAATLSARLLALEPDNAGWIKASAHIALDQAEILLARRDPGVGTRLAAANAQIKALLARDPRNFLWRRDLQAPALLLAARVPGIVVAAKQALDKAMQELEDAACAHTARSPRAQPSRPGTDARRRCEPAQRRSVAASRIWRRGLALLPTAPAPLEPDSRCIRAGLLRAAVPPLPPPLISPTCGASITAIRAMSPPRRPPWPRLPPRGDRNDQSTDHHRGDADAA